MRYMEGISLVLVKGNEIYGRHKFGAGEGNSIKASGISLVLVKDHLFGARHKFGAGEGIVGGTGHKFGAGEGTIKNQEA